MSEEVQKPAAPVVKEEEEVKKPLTEAEKKAEEERKAEEEKRLLEEKRAEQDRKIDEELAKEYEVVSVDTDPAEENPADFKPDQYDEVGKEIPLLKSKGVIKKVITQGIGRRPPKGSDVKVHYVGTLLDGTQFDSSRERKKPLEFKLGDGSMIKGWDVGIAKMRPGELCVLTCKPEYAYGDHEQEKIPANSTLNFEVELLGWSDEKDITQKGDKGIMKKIFVEGDKTRESPFDETKTILDVIVQNGMKKIVEIKKKWEYAVEEEEFDCPGLDLALKSMKVGEKARFKISKKYAGNTWSKYDNLILEIHLRKMMKPKGVYQVTPEETIKISEQKRLEGNEFYKQKKPAMAIKRYTRAIDYITIDGAFTPEQKAQAKTMKASCNLNIAAVKIFEKDYKKAIYFCNKSMELEPSNPKAFLRRAKAYKLDDQWDLALKDVERALEFDPGNAEAMKEQANLKKMIADFDKKQKSVYAGMFDSK